MKRFKQRGRLPLMIIPMLALLAGFTAAPASADTGKEIATLRVLDNLERAENPLSKEGSWSPLVWAGGTVKAGQATTTGWGTVDGYPDINGAFWSTQAFTSGTFLSEGDAVAVTVHKGVAGAERWLSLWLNMPEPGVKKSGYQLKLTMGSVGGTYKVDLLKWTAGSATTLTSNSSVTIPTGQTIALSRLGSTLNAWVGEGTNLTSFLSATSSTYPSGYVGIEASGAASKSNNFRAGALNPTGQKIEGMSVLDSMERPNEDPLSNGGKWLKTSWAQNPGRVGEFACCGLGRDWGARWNTELSGAYWTPALFSEGTTGDAVSVDLEVFSHWNAYQSIWLNMPKPNSERSGYELRWTQTHINGGDGHYILTLSRWTAGVQTVLASNTLKEVNNIALVKKGNVVSAWAASWLDYGDRTYRPQLSAIDSNYSNGYAGIEEPGYGEGGIANFSAGALGN